MDITNNQIRPVTLDTTSNVSPRVNSDSSNQDKVVIEQKLVGEERAAEPVNEKELTEAVSHINDYVQSVQRNLQFTVDQASGKDVVTVIDSQSQEVIRQLPSEEALELARRLAANKEDGVQLISTQV